MKAKVNDRFEYLLSELSDIEQVEKKGDRYLVRYQGKNVEISLLDFDPREKTCRLSIFGFTFKVSLHDELDDIVRNIRLQTSSSDRGEQFYAPIPGMIKSLSLVTGAEVSEGDTLLVLEAMKMENAITAKTAGSGLAYYVSPGDHVRKGQLLCSLE